MTFQLGGPRAQKREKPPASEDTRFVCKVLTRSMVFVAAVTLGSYALAALLGNRD